MATDEQKDQAIVLLQQLADEVAKVKTPAEWAELSPVKTILYLYTTFASLLTWAGLSERVWEKHACKQCDTCKRADSMWEPTILTMIKTLIILHQVTAPGSRVAAAMEAEGFPPIRLGEDTSSFIRAIIEK